MLRRMSPALAIVAILATTGCAGTNLGNIGEILGGMAGAGGAGGAGGGTNEVRGQVSYVDQQRSELEIQTERGERGRLAYDSRTEVIYQNQRHAVANLEPGDRVLVRFQQAQGGQLYAQQIYVEQNVRDTGGGGTYGSGSGRVQRFEGQVGGVDTQRGRFELRTNSGTYIVTLPYNLDAASADRFRRLRSGDRVRVEGELLGSDRLELYRFY